MQIIEFNHKTAANLLKKSVEKFWLDDSKDAWVQFMDGGVVCIHVLDPKWDTYVSLDAREGANGVSFADKQDTHLWWPTKNKESLFTDRSVSIDFGNVRYYYHSQFDYITRQHIPVIELYYYEKGETIANHD